MPTSVFGFDFSEALESGRLIESVPSSIRLASLQIGMAFLSFGPNLIYSYSGIGIHDEQFGAFQDAISRTTVGSVTTQYSLSESISYIGDDRASLPLTLESEFILDLVGKILSSNVIPSTGRFEYTSVSFDELTNTFDAEYTSIRLLGKTLTVSEMNDTDPQPSPVPLPAFAVLLLAAVGGLGALRLHKRAA